MNKKGGTQVDWVISLAIFLVYLMIFFMFLRPRLEPVTHTDSFPALVAEGVVEDASWSVYNAPLFINTNDSLIIANLPFNYSDFYTAKYHSYLDNKIFFINENSSYINLIYSSKNYSKPFLTKDFTADNNSFTNSKLDVGFNNFMPDDLEYENNQLITDFSFDDFGANEFSFYEDSLLANFKASSSIINHSCFLVDDFSRTYCYVNSDKTNVESINFSFTLELTSDFNSWNTLTENIVFVDGCETKNNISFINFDGNDDIALVLNPNADVAFCYDNSSLDVELSFNDVSDFSYSIFAHENEDIETYTNRYDFGITIENKGLSLDKLNNLTTTDYETIKANWNLPNENDFSFDVINLTYNTITNTTVKNTIYTYNQSAPHDLANVYATTFNDFILDKFNILHPVEVVVRTW